MGQCLLLKSGGAKRLGKIVLFDGSNGGRNPDYPIVANNTATIGTAEIKVNNGSANNEHGARTSKKIDVTNLKTVHMRCYANPWDSRYKFHLYLGNATGCIYTDSPRRITVTPTDNSVYEVTLNVSAQVGSYYIYATMNPGAAYAYFAIQKWWCE